MDAFTVTSRINGRVEELEIPLREAVASPHRSAYTRKASVKYADHRYYDHSGADELSGREGSRRRRRMENAKLLGCPQRVEPSGEDWSIAPTHKRRVLSWDKALQIDPTALRSRFTTNKSTSTGSDDRPRLSRSLRHELKRQHVSPAFVQSIESEVRDMLFPADAEPEYDTVDDSFASDSSEDVASRRSPSRTVRIAIEAPTDKATAYLRYFVHLICQYYALRSESSNVGIGRFACVEVKHSFRLPETWFCELL